MRMKVINRKKFVMRNTESTSVEPTSRQAKFSRVWAMPSSSTFDIPPIAGFVLKYLMKSAVSVDPFARNKRWATYTNDLNPETAAEEHLDAEDFLKNLLDNRFIRPDLVIFDPPYSPSQVAEVYQRVGEKNRDGGGGRNSELYRRVRNEIKRMAIPGTIVLSFGWNSAGMGRGWKLLEILLVCHGGAHNDTICLAEQKECDDPDLFVGGIRASQGVESSGD